MPNTVVIIGGGQLGSRYLQGLSPILENLNIYLVDKSTSAIETSKMRWIEADGHLSSHTVTFSTNLEALPYDIDIAIIATTANARVEVMANLTNVCSVRFWVIEKVLAQSTLSLNSIYTIACKSEGAWVNTPRRAMALYQEMRNLTMFEGPFILDVDGGSWGLACNSIHFLDLLCWWSKEELLYVCTSKLHKRWIPSKRENFFEVTGTIEAHFHGGSKARLRSNTNDSKSEITISDRDGCWIVDEYKGIATRTGGAIVTKAIPMQSKMTADLISSILHSGTCTLPEIGMSIRLHRPLLEGLLHHWNLTSRHDTQTLPIT